MPARAGRALLQRRTWPLRMAYLVNRREVARVIVRLRRLLILGLIARMVDDDEAELFHIREFTELANCLPLRITIGAGLVKYVETPAYRKIDREGLLAQNTKGLDL